jgi:hypothetical protein
MLRSRDGRLCDNWTMRIFAIALMSIGVGVALGLFVRGPSESEKRLANLVAAAERPPKEVSLREWLAAQPKPEIPSGTGKITGTVNYEDGRPAPGIKMKLQIIGGDPSWGAMTCNDPSDIEQVVRGVLWHWHVYWIPVDETTTNERGEYTFEGLAGESYAVTAYLDGYRIERDDDRIIDPDAVADFIAKPLHKVVLDVRLPDGRQPSRAELSILQADGGRGGSWDPAGNVGWFTAGKYEITAAVWRSDVHLYESNTASFEIRPGDDPRDLKLSLEPAVE